MDIDVGNARLLGGELLDQRVGAADPKPGATEKKVDFTKDIQPLFKESCVRCHKAPEARGGPGGGPVGGPGGGPGRGGPRARGLPKRMETKPRTIANPWKAIKSGRVKAAVVAAGA